MSGGRKRGWVYVTYDVPGGKMNWNFFGTPLQVAESVRQYAEKYFEVQPPQPSKMVGMKVAQRRRKKRKRGKAN